MIPSADSIQRRLLLLAAAFLFLAAAALTLSPAGRARSWAADYRWTHWLGVFVWILVFTAAHWQSARHLPERDAYLLPTAAMLSGWGLLTVWRLTPEFGLRQTLWLALSGTVLALGLRWPSILSFLRRYKYLWLTASILLTALTLLAGINPLGAGPRLWLGCCGVYFQPSEPLKLTLIVYLAAYFAAKLQPTSPRRPSAVPPPGFLSLLAPTLIMAGLALALLVVQRDLGTATILLFLYAVVVYTATGRWEVLLSSAAVVAVTGIAGYFLFDVVRLRIEAWLNPWLDPSGRSYQIVQSLLAVANGGLFGRGLGLGSPGLVPLSHSDFAFAALSEENGLLGAVGLLGLLALLAARGLRVALLADDPYRRYLAAGLTAYLLGQSLLIIGGNLRLLPLTGVTLPFVSYGGSSLLTVFVSLLILMHLSAPPAACCPSAGQAPLSPYVAWHHDNKALLRLGAFLLGGIVAASLAAGWWALYRGPALLTRTDNARRAIADRYVRRGALLDRHNTPLVETTGSPGNLIRRSLYPPLGPTLGYTHPVYGQSGLEASLDAYLRGLKGYPALRVWWHHLLYGQPPPGLDVRLSLDLDLQRVADAALGEHSGAIVLLNAQTGEILAISSHPYFDANTLDGRWAELIQDETSPLFDRAVLGEYPVGAAMGPLLWGAVRAREVLPLASPDAVSILEEQLGAENVSSLYQRLGLFTAPAIRLPTGAGRSDVQYGVRASPLQVALAVAALSAQGTRPAPLLVSAVHTPQAGWVLLPSLGQPAPILPAGAVNETLALLTDENSPTWSFVSTIPAKRDQPVTWFVGGTLPDWQGAPLALAVLLEADNAALAFEIGQTVLQAAIH